MFSILKTYLNTNFHKCTFKNTVFLRSRNSKLIINYKKRYTFHSNLTSVVNSQTLKTSIIAKTWNQFDSQIFVIGENCIDNTFKKLQKGDFILIHHPFKVEGSC